MIGQAGEAGKRSIEFGFWKFFLWNANQFHFRTWLTWLFYKYVQWGVVVCSFNPDLEIMLSQQSLKSVSGKLTPKNLHSIYCFWIPLRQQLYIVKVHSKYYSATSVQSFIKSPKHLRMNAFKRNEIRNNIELFLMLISLNCRTYVRSV